MHILELHHMHCTICTICTTCTAYYAVAPSFPCALYDTAPPDWIVLNLVGWLVMFSTCTALNAPYWMALCSTRPGWLVRLVSWLRMTAIKQARRQAGRQAGWDIKLGRKCSPAAPADSLLQSTFQTQFRAAAQNLRSVFAHSRFLLTAHQLHLCCNPCSEQLCKITICWYGSSFVWTDTPSQNLTTVCSTFQISFRFAAFFNLMCSSLHSNLNFFHHTFFEYICVQFVQ